MNSPSSGMGPSRDRAAPIILRLLPHVHHPPARVLVPDGREGFEARALDARGYRVTAMGDAPTAPGIAVLSGSFLDATGGPYDLVCDAGWFAQLGARDQGRYVAAAARVLRPGGLLFGAFPADIAGAGGLIAQIASHFDVARLEPSGAAGGWFEAVFVRR
jgi:hypothetical protein